MAASSDDDNPLEKWRKKSSFDVTALRNLLYTEELVEFKQQVQDTLARDPLFSQPDGELTLNEKRELTFKRVKRVVEYGFLDEEEYVSSPLKAPALYSVLLILDSGMAISWQLSNEARGNCTCLSCH